ncbi:phage tail sheath subtilisin-like domain-containing protein [Breznakiella homolactica]|uniref:Phage tail sheath family protein n=2 Tax=Breznakiella homolactica TaxID=2798577 RepID=A0A7T7XS11_9SPIR|nr:phage tail sheath subtilisin-like domain-containing protein [Breznakiella homolactica]
MKCQNGGFQLEAKSEGIWGNYIKARVWHETDAAAPVRGADGEEGNWIELENREIREQDILRISLSGRSVYRTVVRKENDICHLDKPLRLLRGIKDPSADIKAEKAFVSLSLSCKGKTENYLHLSTNPASERYLVSYVNERSRLCVLHPDQPEGIITPFFEQTASGGNDGIAEISPGDFIGHYNGLNDHRGLGALESRDDISLIAAPDIPWLLGQAGKTPEEREQGVFAVQSAMVEQAERFPGRFAVLDIPGVFDSLKAMQWAKKFDSPSAAAYYPSIDVIDPLDPQGFKTVRIPPSGAICGSIVATDSEKGIFHAPANTTLQGAVGLSSRIEDREYELLYPAGVNLLKYFPGRGIKIWGVRTLSSDPEWKYINVRRTFSAICKSLKQGTQWAVFEPNDKNLRKRLVRQVSGFLLDLWLKGYLAGSTAEQGFFVRCDEELNPPENIDQGILTFEAGLAITKPAEFFTIFITAEKEGASVYIEES